MKDDTIDGWVPRESLEKFWNFLQNGGYISLVGEQGRKEKGNKWKCHASVSSVVVQEVTVLLGSFIIVYELYYGLAVA